MTDVQTMDADGKIRIFVSFAYDDEKIMLELLKQLRSLDRLGLTEIWHGRNIKPGEKFSPLIQQHLNSADLILLLISPDFIESRYCYEIEAKRALERDAAGEATVVPVILRPSLWDKLPLGDLQVLPTDGKAVISWLLQDEALEDVARGILTVVKDIKKKRTTSQTRKSEIQIPPTLSPQSGKMWPDYSAPAMGELFLQPGKTLPGQSTPSSGEREFQQGHAFFQAGAYEQALHAFELARHFDPSNADIYRAISASQILLDRPEEALVMQRQVAYLEAVQYSKQGDMLRALGDYDNALLAYTYSLLRAPTMVETYHKKADLHQFLGQKYEALEAYEQARRLMDD